MRLARCAVAASALLATGASAGPPCRARIVLEPASAFVGQQVVYRLQIFRRSDVASVRFARELAFPSFRADWLPGQSPDPAIAGVGEHPIVFEERRALFPARAGELEIPAAQLVCRSDAATEGFEAPPVRIAVRELPEAGRPEGFRGVVGRIELQAHLSRERIALGESLALAIRARGAANLWDAADPFDAARELPGVVDYPRPAELDRETGPSLVVARSFVHELVPRATGSFAIGPLRLPYFDPATGRYAVAESEPLRFAVEAAAAATAPAPPAASVAGGNAPTRARVRGGAVLAVAGLVGLAALAWGFARRRAARGAPGRAAAPHLAAARAASARGDRIATANALAAALRAALDARVPGAGALAAEELARHEKATIRAVAETLRALDRERFAPEGAASRVPDPEAVRARIASL